MASIAQPLPASNLSLADRIEGIRLVGARGLDDSGKLLKQTIEETQAEASRGLAAGRAQSFITLLRGIVGLTISLASELLAEFGGHVGHS